MHCDTQNQRPYDPGYLYKLLLYGYSIRVRGARPLSLKCRGNIEVMWLINHLTPDFRMIAGFRAFNKGPIKRAFKRDVPRQQIRKETAELPLERSSGTTGLIFL